MIWITFLKSKTQGVKNGIELIKTRKNTIPSDQNGVINIKFKKGERLSALPFLF